MTRPARGLGSLQQRAAPERPGRDDDEHQDQQHDQARHRPGTAAASAARPGRRSRRAPRATPPGRAATGPTQDEQHARRTTAVPRGVVLRSRPSIGGAARGRPRARRPLGSRDDDGRQGGGAEVDEGAPAARSCSRPGSQARSHGRPARRPAAVAARRPARLPAPGRRPLGGVHQRVPADLAGALAVLRAEDLSQRACGSAVSGLPGRPRRLRPGGPGGGRRRRLPGGRRAGRRARAAPPVRGPAADRPGRPAVVLPCGCSSWSGGWRCSRWSCGCGPRRRRRPQVGLRWPQQWPGPVTGAGRRRSCCSSSLVSTRALRGGALLEARRAGPPAGGGPARRAAGARHARRCCPARRGSGGCSRSSG